MFSIEAAVSTPGQTDAKRWILERSSKRSSLALEVEEVELSPLELVSSLVALDFFWASFMTFFLIRGLGSIPVPPKQSSRLFFAPLFPPSLFLFPPFGLLSPSFTSRSLDFFFFFFFFFFSLLVELEDSGSFSFFSASLFLHSSCSSLSCAASSSTIRLQCQDPTGRSGNNSTSREWRRSGFSLCWLHSGWHTWTRINACLCPLQWRRTSSELVPHASSNHSLWLPSTSSLTRRPQNSASWPKYFAFLKTRMDPFAMTPGHSRWLATLFPSLNFCSAASGVNLTTAAAGLRRTPLPTRAAGLASLGGITYPNAPHVFSSARGLGRTWQYLLSSRAELSL